jgi:dipeptidyl aminopeptidase/acylaminoacyl peptidase
VWGYDPLVQFLASRGYAVLQVNYRGSTGYGETFARSGDNSKNTTVQADIADGARWAVRQGLADASRVGIIGAWGFSGYSALLNLAREPDIYCCGISAAPDLGWFKRHTTGPKAPKTDDFFGNPLGDYASGSDESSVNSPTVMGQRIKVPVLLLDGGAAASALKKAGRPVQFNTDHDMKYGYQNYGKWLKEVEAFLQKHMPADK